MDKVVEEYKDIFASPIGVPPQYQVKHSIDLTPGTSLPNGLIYRCFVLKNDEIKRQIQELLQKGHIRPSSSPCGSPIVLDVGKYIRFCIACAIAKPTIKKQGLSTPLPTPNWTWESVSMDYMLGLTSTMHNNDCIFVVVDRFSKMAIMVACKKSISVDATAKLFIERVWVHFGIPQSIISDWDNRFLNAFWSSLWSMLETKLTKSMTFHP
eukprot:PITA_27765